MSLVIDRLTAPARGILLMILSWGLLVPPGSATGESPLPQVNSRDLFIAQDAPPKKGPPRRKPGAKGKGKAAEAQEKPADPPAPASTLKVTVDDVEYVYQGSVRSGENVTVTVLATSRNGDRSAPHGRMTLIDSEGNEYSGASEKAGGPRVLLRENVPVKLSWRFGPNGFNSQLKAPAAKVTQFALVSIAQEVAGRGNEVEFRNVPAVVRK
ncbi:MAG: hypothetical protein U0935_12810 [Pirellulales bacterium]